MSPMQRSLDHLRACGFTPAKTEHFNKFARVRQDLFGFIDILAVNETWLIGLQTTDGSHHAERREKVLANPIARLLAYHMEIEVWSWEKKGAAGLTKRWTLRRESLTAKLLPKKSLRARLVRERSWLGT